MKKFSTLALLIVFLVSCGSPNYFFKQADASDPHAILAVKNGTTQVVKVDGKYPPDGAEMIRLEPGVHTLEVNSQASQMGAFNALLGLPGRDVNTQTTMQVDLAPSKTYRPDCNINGARGASFYLIDQSGIRSNFSRAYSQGY